jgi:hypothetical protein
MLDEMQEGPDLDPEEYQSFEEEDSDLNHKEYQQLTDERGSSPGSLGTGNGDLF